VNGENVNSIIELRLPSRLGFEKIAMSTASSVAKLMGFAPDRVEDLKTAVAEACINAMEHGNKLDESLIKVLDTGTGPPEGVHAPDMDKKMHGEEASRGMGMFLIQSLVDEAEWVSAPLTGSYARLVIRLNKTED
jgi:serine/threonine-protein kinase RsbW